MINVPEIPDELMPNEISIFPAIMGQDADAAYSPTYAASPSMTLHCSAQPRDAEELIDIQGRITRILNYHIFFNCDPGVFPRDKIVTVDSLGNTRTLFVQATSNEGGANIAWVVRAIERL